MIFESGPHNRQRLAQERIRQEEENSEKERREEKKKITDSANLDSICNNWSPVGR